MAVAEGQIGAAFCECFALRIAEAGLGEVAKIDQRARGIAGAGQRAVAGKSGRRRLHACDQTLQPLDQWHGA